jgi:cell division transport system ATP-binding protein
MLLFEQFNQVGVTVLIASHDLGLIARMPHRLLTLRDGGLVRGVDRGVERHPQSGDDAREEAHG